MTKARMKIVDQNGVRTYTYTVASVRAFALDVAGTYKSKLMQTANTGVYCINTGDSYITIEEDS